jgi:hypothetical protein
MKIRCTRPTGYRGTLTFQTGEVREVEDCLASTLLANLPGWFEAVGGPSPPMAEVSVNPVIGEKNVPAPPRSKPYSAKGKK